MKDSSDSLTVQMLGPGPVNCLAYVVLLAGLHYTCRVRVLGYRLPL